MITIISFLNNVLVRTAMSQQAVKIIIYFNLV